MTYLEFFVPNTSSVSRNHFKFWATSNTRTKPFLVPMPIHVDIVKQVASLDFNLD